MNTIIYYNGQQIVSGQPVPLVGRQDSTIRYGERWGIKSTLTLQGTLTGCTFTDLISAQSSLISGFSKDFQSLEVVNEGNQILFEPEVIVKSIAFQETKYVGILPYTVTLDFYESGYFSGVYGVLDPSDEWAFQSTLDGRMNVVHTISARGINTTNFAFDNAKNFVNQHSGFSGQIFPMFVTGAPTPCLDTIEEKIDRFNGTYGLVENYSYDTVFSSCLLLRYTTDYECNPSNGATTVALKGSIEGNLASSLSDLKTRYAQFDPYQAAANAASGISLNLPYLSSGVTEGQYPPKLAFNISFNNQTLTSGIWFDYTTDVRLGDDGITRVGVDGTIRGYGDLANKWAIENSMVAGFIGDLYTYATSAYSAFNTTSATLNPFPITQEETFNQFAGEIKIGASYDNRPTPADNHFREIDFTYSFNDSVGKVGVTPLTCQDECDKSYFLADLNYNTRAEFTLEGTAYPICGLSAFDALSYLQALIDTIFKSEVQGASRVALTKHQFTPKSLTNGNEISFVCSWTFEPAVQATSSPSFSQVANLSVILS